MSIAKEFEIYPRGNRKRNRKQGQIF